MNIESINNSKVKAWAKLKEKNIEIVNSLL